MDARQQALTHGLVYEIARLIHQSGLPVAAHCVWLDPDKPYEATVGKTDVLLKMPFELMIVDKK